MGTRTGDLDPGVLVYLTREKKLDVVMLEDLVDHRSGLLGISGVSSDMRRCSRTLDQNLMPARNRHVLLFGAQADRSNDCCT